jgi:hypothetical protein
MSIELRNTLTILTAFLLCRTPLSDRRALFFLRDHAYLAGPRACLRVCPNAFLFPIFPSSFLADRGVSFHDRAVHDDNPAAVF